MRGTNKKKFTEGRLEEVFRKKSTPLPSRRKFDGEEAKLMELCCWARWTFAFSCR